MKSSLRVPVRVAALTAAMVVGAATAVTQTASADPSPRSSDTTAVLAPVLARPGSGSGQTKTYSAAERDGLKTTSGDPAVKSYWTKTRLKQAKLVDLPGDAGARAHAMEKASPTTPSKIASSPVAGQSPKAKMSAKRVTNFSPTNGKIFFHNASNGKDYACSGSSVNSGSKRLVITAGHCVYGAPGSRWHTNVIFIPGYANGSRPYGTFTAYTMRTFNDWITYQEARSGRGFNSDVAFITTYRGTKGGRVVDTVGGHGLEYGGGFGFNASIFGYPGNLNGGQVMWACWGHTGSRYVGLYRENSISGCNFGGGSSGGPWLNKYNNASGQGYVRSVTSNGPSTSVAYIAGPYFDARVNTLFKAANGDW